MNIFGGKTAKKDKIIILIDFENATKGTTTKSIEGGFDAVDMLNPNFGGIITECAERGEVVFAAAFGPNIRSNIYDELCDLGYLVCVSPPGEGKDFGRVDRNLMKTGMKVFQNMEVDEVVVVSDDGDMLELYNEALMRGIKVTVLEVHRLNFSVKTRKEINVGEMPTSVTKGSSVIDRR